MKNTKEKIIPFFDCEEQTKVGLTSESWVIIASSSIEQTQVIYFNPKENPDEFESFDSFVECYKENEFYLSDSNENVENKYKNFTTLIATSTSLEDDFDEDSGKSWQVTVGKAIVSDIYNGGITKENLDEKIKATEKSVDEAVDEAIYEENDAQSYRKDPYAYYGVKRSDFY